MLVNGVNFDDARLAAIAAKYGATRLRLFGSILTSSFTPESDIDILVEFAPNTRIGLVGMANMEADLTDAIGRRVDLRTLDDLSRLFRADIDRLARPLHAA